MLLKFERGQVWRFRDGREGTCASVTSQLATFYIGPEAFVIPVGDWSVVLDGASLVLSDSVEPPPARQPPSPSSPPPPPLLVPDPPAHEPPLATFDEPFTQRMEKARTRSPETDVPAPASVPSTAPALPPVKSGRRKRER